MTRFGYTKTKIQTVCGCGGMNGETSFAEGIDGNLGTTMERSYAGALCTVPSRPRILIAEDHESIADTYKIMLEDLGFEVTIIHDGQECMESFDRTFSRTASEELRTEPISCAICNGRKKRSIPAPFNLVILDYHLPNKDGMDIAKHILSVVPTQRIVIASSYPVSVIEKSAESAGLCLELLVKPFGLDALEALAQGEKALEIVGDNCKQSLTCLLPGSDNHDAVTDNSETNNGKVLPKGLSPEEPQNNDYFDTGLTRGGL